MSLFAKVGYNSAATRAIAAAADVNEATLFRCFTTKRQLFEAALAKKLGSVRVSAELLSRVATATDFHDTVGALLDLVTDIVANEPDLVRMLHFTALEFGTEMAPIVRANLGRSIESISERIAQTRPAVLESVDPALLITYLIISVASAVDFFPLLTGRELSAGSHAKSAKLYSDICRVLLLRNFDPAGQSA